MLASAGTLMYSEIQDIVANGATVIGDKDAAITIVTWCNNQWVSYNNNNTLKAKMDYANQKCLGGVMVGSDPYSLQVIVFRAHSTQLSCIRSGPPQRMTL